MCVFRLAFCKDFKLEKDTLFNEQPLSSVNNADRKQERWMSHRLAFDSPLTTRMSYQLCLSQKNRSQRKGAGILDISLISLSISSIKLVCLNKFLGPGNTSLTFHSSELQLHKHFFVSTNILLTSVHIIHTFKVPGVQTPPIILHFSLLKRKRKPPC